MSSEFLAAPAPPSLARQASERWAQELRAAAERRDGSSASGWVIREPTPLPWAKILSVFFVLTCEAFISTSVFSYIAFLVVDFGYSDDIKNAGYASGILASCFFGAQVASSYAWGVISDRIGFRPVLIVGAVGSTIFSLAFAFSTSYPWAIVSRSLSGLLNGSVGAAKSYVGAITDSTNQARAFGLTGLAWGIGSIAGSTCGGLLARPAQQYPGLFSEDGFFGTFPYFLPNALAVLLNLIGLVMVVKYAEEPKRRKRFKKKQSEKVPSEPTSRDSVEMQEMLLERTSADDAESALNSVSNGNTNGKSSSPAPSSVSANEDDATPTASEDTLAARSPTTGERLHPPSVFHIRVAMLCVLLYAGLGGLWTFVDETLPLLLPMKVQDGGVDFQPIQVGIFNGMNGLSVVIIQMTAWPYLTKRFSYLALIRVASVIALCFLFFFPMISFASFSVVVTWLSLFALAFIRSLAANLMFSSTIILLNNSVPTELLGSINGVGQTAVAVLRAVAPVAAGSVFAFSHSHGVPWLSWVIIMLFITGFVCETMFTPAWLQVPFAERCGVR